MHCGSLTGRGLARVAKIIHPWFCPTLFSPHHAAHYKTPFHSIDLCCGFPTTTQGQVISVRAGPLPSSSSHLLPPYFILFSSPSFPLFLPFSSPFLYFSPLPNNLLPLPPSFSSHFFIPSLLLTLLVPCCVWCVMTFPF